MPNTVLTDDRSCYTFPNFCKGYPPIRDELPYGHGIDLLGWPKGAVRYNGRYESREDINDRESKDSQWHGRNETTTGEPSAVSTNDDASYTFSDGYKYYGPLRKGLPHGEGIATWPNGEMFYKGRFKNGKAHGIGVYTGLDGYSYEGEFKDGIANGYGIAAYPRGNIYVGRFKAAKRHGKGVLTYQGGGKYHGDWENDKMHGLGIYTWSDGIQKYKGLWKEGKKHGLGVMTDANDNILHLSLNEMLLHFAVINSLSA